MNILRDVCRSFESIDELIQKSEEEFVHLITVNAEILLLLYENPKLQDIAKNAFYTVDGVGVKIPLLLLEHVAKPRICGSDLLYDLAEKCAARNERLFLLGATEDSNAGAVKYLNLHYGVDVAGFSPDFDGENMSKALLKIADFSPACVFVAFGAPKQEFWIDTHREVLIASGVRLVIGCGGAIDFVSGVAKRAPRLVQNVGLEWLHRAITQPRRIRREFKKIKLLYFLFVEMISKNRVV